MSYQHDQGMPGRQDWKCVHIHSQAVHLSTVELKLMSPSVAPCGVGAAQVCSPAARSRHSRLAIDGLWVCGVSAAGTEESSTA